MTNVQKTDQESKGVVLFGHGSRDPLWHKPMEAVAAHIRALSPSTPVLCAYLEISTPDLASACATLIESGVQAIQVVPMFLGLGRHAREDLPVLVERMRQQHPSIAFTLQPAVSENERMIRLLAEIALDGC